MFTDSQIDALRKKVGKVLSPKRYSHTLGVEKCAVRLCRLCLSGYEDEIAAAALLHDITKELSQGEQLSLLTAHDLPLTETELESPQIFHSYTAPIVISSDYREFAVKNVLSAVKNHTVGAPDMSIFDEIIFLADYIEEGREYPQCRELYEYTFSEMVSGDLEYNISVLHKASFKSINHTISNLIDKNRVIIEKTLLTRNALLAKILQI